MLVLVSSQDALTGVPQPRDATFLAIDNLAYSTTRDTDGDGIGDHSDLDSDNDGISDLVESGQDASVVDTDNDGVHNGAVDTTTGVPQAANGGAGVNPVDSDSDNVNDFLDLDSDNDGIPDIVESQPTGTYTPASGTDTDSDGIDDAFDSTAGHGGDFTAPENTDGDTNACLLYTSPSPRDATLSRMPSSA